MLDNVFIESGIIIGPKSLSGFTKLSERSVDPLSPSKLLVIGE